MCIYSTCVTAQKELRFYLAVAHEGGWVLKIKMFSLKNKKLM
jgi:hypothetical protein